MPHTSFCIECMKPTKYFVQLSGWVGLVPLCKAHLPTDSEPKNSPNKKLFKETE